MTPEVRVAELEEVLRETLDVMIDNGVGVGEEHGDFCVYCDWPLAWPWPDPRAITDDGPPHHRPECALSRIAALLGVRVRAAILRDAWVVHQFESGAFFFRPGFTGAAAARSASSVSISATSSSMSHTRSVTFASIAGVTRRVLWIRHRL